jgi:hypothetical protein
MIFPACSKKVKQVSVDDTQRGNLETDYAGKVTFLLASQVMASADSLKLLQYCYQMAALDAELYKLQNTLIKSYYNACDQKCETGKCSHGDIACAAMACYLDGATDSALALCQSLGPDGKTGPEAREIALIIRSALSTNSQNELSELIKSQPKTASALAFLSIVATNKGIPQGVIEGKIGKSKLLDLQYAHAYALTKSPDIKEAWAALPDYPPYSRSFPDPSFIDKIQMADTILTEKIYLPLGLYVRKQIDNLLLTTLFAEIHGEESAADISALKALAYARDLGGISSDFLAANSQENPQDPRTELLLSLKLAQSSPLNPASQMAGLRFPISRAAYLQYAIYHTTEADRAGLTQFLMAEMDTSRMHMIWESRVLLSLALTRQLGQVEAFRQMGNFGVSDLSVSNNSPEWLAIYARAGLFEGSQLGLVSQLIFNLSQHYPHLIGLYEMAQSYNHICKYF